MKVCPYCEQDDLWHVSITGVDEDAVMCGECDTVWKHNEEVVYGNGKNFDDFMAAHGKEANWNTIQRKEKVES